MAVITVVGTKGGTGKSTAAMGISIWMSRLTDEWILLIDGDIHVRTIGLKMCPMTDVTLSEVMEGKAQVEDAIYLCQLESNGKPLYDSLAILPAGGRFLPSMRGNPIEFIEYTKRKFDQMMKKLKKNFSRIIVDTPASMSFEHLILTAIADGIVYVVEPNEDSITSTLQTARGLKEFMEVEPIGTVINRMPHYKSYQDWVKRAGEIAPVLGTVPEDEAVDRAFTADLPVVAAYPDSSASLALRGIASKLLDMEIAPSKSVARKIGTAITKSTEKIPKRH